MKKWWWWWIVHTLTLSHCCCWLLLLLLLTMMRDNAHAKIPPAGLHRAWPSLPAYDCWWERTDERDLKHTHP